MKKIDISGIEKLGEAMAKLRFIEKPKKKKKRGAGWTRNPVCKRTGKPIRNKGVR